MTPRRQICLHLGYAKTGTTTLQRAFFDRLSAMDLIHYFGMFLTAPANDPNRSFFNKLTASLYVDEAEFSKRVADLKDSLQACVGHEAKAIPLVLSNEHFLLSSYATRARGLTISIPRTAQRLAAVFDAFDVKMLVGLRRQDSLMHSFFTESAARSDHKNAEHFRDLDAYIATCMQAGSVFHTMFRFDESVNAYESAFPESPFFIYPFETFLRDQKAVLRRILEFIDLDESLADVFETPLPNHNMKSKSSAGVELKRRSTFHEIVGAVPGATTLYQHLRNIRPIWGLNESFKRTLLVPHLNEDQRSKIVTRFKQANALLAERRPELRIDLLTYGYI